MIRPRFSPEPLNAFPISETTVRRLCLSTEFTVESRSVSSLVVEIGVSVIPAGIWEESVR
jgi:hypothetical protein